MGVKYLVLLCCRGGERQVCLLSACWQNTVGSIPGPDLTTKFLQNPIFNDPEMSCRGLAMAVLTA